MARHIVNRIATVLLGRSIARLAQFLAFVLLGRMLTAAELGLYGVFTASVVLMTQLCSLGLRQSVALHLGESGSGQGGVLADLLTLWPLLSIITAVGVIASLPATVCSPWFLGLVLAASAGSMATVLMQGALLGLGKTALFGLSDSLMPALLLSGIFVLYLIDLSDPWLVLTVLCVSQFVAGLISIGLAIHSGGLAKPSTRRLPPMLRLGLVFSLNMFLILFTTRVSLYLVSSLLSDYDAGQFFVGQRLADVLGELVMALGFVLFSDMVRSEDRQAQLRVAVRISAALLWSFGFASLAVVSLAPWVVRLTFGSDYEEAVPVLQIAALAIGPTAFTKVVYPLLAGTGKPLWGTPALLASVIANVAFTCLLVPSWGLRGAATALLIGQVVLMLGYAWTLRKNCGIPLRDSLLPRLPRRRI